MKPRAKEIAGNGIDDLFTKQVASLPDLSLKDKAHFFGADLAFRLGYEALDCIPV